MPHRLERLLAVQSLDMELAALEERRDEVPRRRAEVTREITELEGERTEREQALDTANLVRRTKEGDLEVLRDRLTRYERQLNEVKTNVAYSALLSEMQRAKREISQLEDEILDLMGFREDHEKRVVEIEAALTELRMVAASELEALAIEEREIEGAMEASHSRRETLVADVQPSLYRMYDRLRRGRRFPALVPLRGTACGACHSALPPQIVREITHTGSLHPCEACGVLVYAAPEGEPASAVGPPGRGSS